MKVQFSAVVEVPDGTPESDIENWLRFELGETGQLAGGNAMNHTDLMSAGCRQVSIDRTWPTPNAPHEGRTAALSPGVPLDAVVGGLTREI